MIFAIFLSLFTTFLLYHVYVKLSRRGRMINRFPGPKTYPIFGNIFDIQLDAESFFLAIREWNAKYYPIYRLWSVNLCAVNLLHPDDVEVILSSPKHIDKSRIYKFLEPWLSTGLLTSTGSKWHNRRKILTPAFHFNILKHFTNIFIETSEHLVKTLNEEGRDGPIVKDLTELIGEHTLNTICETAMGISIRGKSSAQTNYQNAIKTIGKLLSFRLSRPWYISDFVFGLSPNGRLQKKILKILHSFTENIIAERKHFHESTNRKYLQNFEKMDENTMNFDTKNDGDNVTVGKKRLAMLDLLISTSLEDNNLINDKGIREEVDTFTFEGHDTTSMALCYALLLFAKHKDVQERIREEVKEAMVKKDYKQIFSVSQNFSYLERCLKETLRLYPIVPFISREIKEDCQLKNYTIPADTMCHIHIYEIHRNPTFWPNPLVFDPDRFLPENIKGHHPYSYIPFSAGLRNCIGQKFAMLEMKVLVAFVLHNFALEPVSELDDVRMVTDLVLRPAHPLPLKFIPLRD